MAIKKFKLYWVDASCGHNFDVYVQEAMRLAGLAASLLESDNPGFHRVFHILFKAPVTDEEIFTPPKLWHQANQTKKENSHWKTAKDHVIDDLRHFSWRWARTESRELAKVRIFNNRGKRFKVDTNNPTLWHDKLNGVSVSGKLTSTIARVSHPFKSPLPINGPHPKIVTMDLFDGAWVGVNNATLQSLDHLQFKGAPQLSPHVDPPCLDFLPITILHEFMHSVAYGREDHRKKAGGEYR